MRIGGSYVPSSASPEDWIRGCKKMRYSAAVSPIDYTASTETRKDYRLAAEKAGILIAEVGAWSNPISPDTDERTKAVAYCKNQLSLADELGATCCVNISGAVGDRWDGPFRENYSDDTYALIVDTVRDIIDAVNPTHTVYSLETMPWAYPDSADSYLTLIQDIDRAGFAAHLDIVNIINSPKLALFNTELIKDSFKKLGKYIRSCHAKDITLSQILTTHLYECIPGRGQLDYATYITEAEKLSPEIPFIVEHIEKEAEYAEAVDYILHIAEKVGVHVI